MVSLVAAITLSPPTRFLPTLPASATTCLSCCDFKMCRSDRLIKSNWRGEPPPRRLVYTRKLLLLCRSQAEKRAACGRRSGPDKRFEQMGLGERDRAPLCQTPQGESLQDVSPGRTRALTLRWGEDRRSGSSRDSPDSCSDNRMQR